MKIAVLLSGGVDSSLALHLLGRNSDNQLRAFYLKIWLEDDLAFLGDCPWEEDLRYARAVCEQAGVPLEIVPLQSEYRERIVEHALSELRAGRTPSPDIFCNQRIKFGAFLQHVDASFERIASGHYARIQQRQGRTLLLRGLDPIKDQTYFLSNLSQAQLTRLLFPIGHLHKQQVRRLAADFDLPTKDRKDSQGICFLGKIDYRDFVRFHLGEKPGDFVDLASGRRLGRHRGYWFFTIGQRFGLGLGGGPWYVTGKDVERNAVFLSHLQRPDLRQKETFEVDSINWTAAEPDRARVQVKLRHGPDLHQAHVDLGGDGRARVRLDAPDPGIAPGQHAVFYDGDICLGGGIIA